MNLITSELDIQTIHKCKINQKCIKVINIRMQNVIAKPGFEITFTVDLQEKLKTSYYCQQIFYRRIDRIIYYNGMWFQTNIGIEI